ncbi:hypothetical protein MIND_00452200 [Mycena indigotica]|uniref:Mitochondrial import inner membrane translocase subunit Tim21 n=1 Tax=Mycena indigotica TaxID=2126181 RepID=A0A8H6WBR4_9AGAR|nr:uncharacterized protein MIND_00452200 [Mycena indigotica]KAF7306609.1 hypothetical protein MIND_00452200 [Mycena indigotica]
MQRLHRCLPHILRPTNTRSYATKPSLLSHSLDQNNHPNDKGTFQLGFGVGQTTVNRNERVPQWKELSTAGKVNRTAARTSNLGVIVLGAGLTAILLYSLGSDLFSPNSPSVLYEDACKRILASSKLARFLDGTPRFHLDPPAVARPRHRNRHVSSTLRVDASGREHLFLNFYLQSHPQSPSFLESTQTWTQDKFHLLTELSWDEVLDRSRQSALAAWNRAKAAARYLSGTPSPPPPDAGPTDTKKEAAPTPVRSGFMDLFSSLRRPRGTVTEAKAQIEAHGQFNEGEVHVAFVRNMNGDFVLRYIIVELPNSKSKDAVRVFVERAPGVRDTEPVLQWSPSQH